MIFDPRIRDIDRDLPPFFREIDYVCLYLLSGLGLWFAFALIIFFIVYPSFLLP